ncbi:MAG: YeeE/YedE thiosulfate transporter family protein [Caldilineaceae bacterium]
MPFPLVLESLMSKPDDVFDLCVDWLCVWLYTGNFRLWQLEKIGCPIHFQELTVLKVMFTSIVVAMVLIFAASGLGWLDYKAIWVNPTYLWPGIVGGLIMGVGFIIGGFCPAPRW